MAITELALIGAGYDVPQDELVAIASIVPSGDVAFASPKTLALYDDGEIIPLLTMMLYIEGFASVTWQFGFMTLTQLAYLRTTYCNGGLSGEVTIYDYFGTPTPARMNAIMTLPTPKAVQSVYWYKDVPVLFTKLAEAAA